MSRSPAPSPTAGRRRSGARPARRTMLPLALLLAVVPATLAASTAGAQPPPSRRVVVVGDSVILGARPQLTAAFQRAGWAATVDAAVSRSTLAGVDVLHHHAPELTDTLVVSLGANDAGNTATFRQRVDAVMAAARAVPHVYWVTIREVRPYYGPANAVLRDAAARYPNLDVIDWNAATSGSNGLTAGDGLHLTARGAGSMAFVVAGSVLAAQVPPTVPPTTAVPASVAPTTAPPTAAAPTSAPSSTAPPPSTAAPEPAAEGNRAGASPSGARPSGADATDDGGWSGWSIGLGLTGVVAVLALAGAWIAAWSLLRTRGAAEGPARSVRSRLRADRIAASRARHPARVADPGASPGPGAPDPTRPRGSSASVRQS